jgi:hypothetical protein
MLQATSAIFFSLAFTEIATERSNPMIEKTNAASMIE